MTAKLFRLIGAGIVSTTLLAACGGGGGSAPATTPPASTTSFALGTGYAAYITTGTINSHNSFSVAVTQKVGSSTTSCSGTATIKATPAALLAAPSTFGSATNVSASTQDSTLSLANCSLTSNPSHGTTYYNVNSVPIGLSIVNGEYSKFDSLQPDLLALPGSVKVGDTGAIDTMTSYTDSTMSTPTGTRALSYQIVDDAPPSTTTAIANIVTVFSDLATPPNVLSTQTSSYRMAADGTLTLLSIDVQFSAFSDPKQTQLVYTPTN